MKQPPYLVHFTFYKRNELIMALHWWKIKTSTLVIGLIQFYALYFPSRHKEKKNVKWSLFDMLKQFFKGGAWHGTNSPWRAEDGLVFSMMETGSNMLIRRLHIRSRTWNGCIWTRWGFIWSDGRMGVIVDTSPRQDNGQVKH